jgi:hypothetical protein
VTEFADPLPSPPIALLNNSELQNTLLYPKPYIEVWTPFDVNCFKNLLYDHPNQPFVASVMRGLREGFWPFDEGEWNLVEKEYLHNYSSEDLDLDAICAFRDKEINLKHWSKALPSLDLRLGMKISPCLLCGSMTSQE